MMRDNLPPLLVLSIAILLIPSSLRAGGKDEEKPVVSRICIRPASVVPKPYRLEERSTNLVSLSLLAPTEKLTPQEREELKKNFIIVHGVKSNTSLANKLK